MKSFIAALAGAFMLFASSAKALDIYSVDETEIQQALDKKLPLTSKTRFNGSATLLPGASIRFKANGSIEVDGGFEIHHENTSSFIRGFFAATTNITYRNEEQAIFIERTRLDDFNADVIRQKSGNKFKNALAKLTDKAIDKLLNNPNDIRDILAALLFKRLEEKPIYRLDGRKSWHALAKGVLSEDSLIVSEGRLTIRIP